ncbi:glycosyl hydrolase [Listeria monocytogenes]|uniref:glycosyl hydrolase family 18 protein n=1 Tax=Listeria monocytogenes TaxID=1639 RepID=UPI0012CA0000|nr:glycosyl hydrolase family 18 protein [Listeria monocytogenes]ECC0657030.1 glycosyl hydrolase [Listeria monocytogenes]MDJ1536029.1 glycosyl hydrolase family 18 protein [Listeria monocytogenes]NJA47736.1 glycosyl hydrolase [Listeria monocytogenes]NJB14618.1 glycosyl hydrolase [Listeria monocytogenes]
MERLKGKKIMVWTFMGNARMYEALEKYGDRIDTIGLFSFKVRTTGEIVESGVTISSMLPYINRYRHIKWLLTIANDGANSIFRALRDNTNGAQELFLSELIRIMKKYPWCDGIDIDLERGDDYSTHAESTTMFKNIYNTIKAYDSSKLMNICLPGMTSVNGSVGGENWCVYGDLDPYCDTASIMSYGMAWSGSAPGPVSPRSWLEGIYDYAVTVMNPDKIFFGMPAYGWNWQIYDTPENLGKAYRGTSHTYYAAKYWMTGAYNFTDDAPPQPFIPIVAYWDDENKVPWALPHVYDYMEGRDATRYSYPLLSASYNGRQYLTAYGKQQKLAFGTVYVDHDAMPDSYSGVVSVSNSVTTLGDEGAATYHFTLAQAGTYDVAVKLGFPFWDKNSIHISLDGNEVDFSENRLWWPYWRTTFWTVLKKGVSLSQGTHTITISLGAKGAQFYGFRVCSSFSEEPTVGEAEYTLAPRHFKDVNGDMVGPATGFKLTLEMLRRKADSALVWYEDFRDDNPLPQSYWTTLSGEWSVWQDTSSSMNRPYSQLEGKGQLAWNYNNFSDIHLRAQIIFPETFSGKAGVFIGTIYCCFNYDNQRIELYEGSTLKGSYATSFSKTSAANIRSNPSFYTLEIRKRGNQVRVYSSASNALRFTATCSDVTGYAGIRSDNKVHCQLLRLGDAWTYEPYERFDVLMPDGTFKTYGRLSRSNCSWDDEFQVFTLTADLEESATRSESISLDYDFFHSDMMPSIQCGKDYSVTIIPRDINIWISRIFLGDGDGFSILYYQDVDSLVYWANEAAYRWKLRGMCMWSLGQEDLRLWEWLPKQIE